MRKYLFLSILITLTLLFCSCSQVPSPDISTKTVSVNSQFNTNKGNIEEKAIIEEKANENKNNKDIWKGQWNRISTDTYNPSSIDITEVKDSGFTFTIEAESGANIGNVDGSAVFDENSNALYESDNGFKLQFCISNNILKVNILSGNEYDNFLYSFMKISELDDLDGFGAKVRKI